MYITNRHILPHLPPILSQAANALICLTAQKEVGQQRGGPLQCSLLWDEVAPQPLLCLELSPWLPSVRPLKKFLQELCEPPVHILNLGHQFEALEKLLAYNIKDLVLLHVFLEGRIL